LKKASLAAVAICLMLPAVASAHFGWGGGGRINATEMGELGFVGASLIGAAAYLRFRLSRKSK
jgi:hypothetical protein